MSLSGKMPSLRDKLAAEEVARLAAEAEALRVKKEKEDEEEKVVIRKKSKKD